MDDKIFYPQITQINADERSIQINGLFHKVLTDVFKDSGFERFNISQILSGNKEDGTIIDLAV